MKTQGSNLSTIGVFNSPEWSFGRPTETKPERPGPTCEVDMDFVEQQLFYTYRHSGRTRLLYNKLT